MGRPYGRTVRIKHGLDLHIPRMSSQTMDQLVRLLATFLFLFSVTCLIGSGALAILVLLSRATGIAQ